LRFHPGRLPVATKYPTIGADYSGASVSAGPPAASLAKTAMLPTWIWTAGRKRAKRYGRRSAQPRHAPQFALTAAVEAVRAVITQPELGSQQKFEKYRTLPTNIEIPQVSLS